MYTGNHTLPVLIISTGDVDGKSESASREIKLSVSPYFAALSG